MKRIIILLLFALITLNRFIEISVYANGNELLILKNNVQIKSDPDSLQTIKELQKLDKVIIVKSSLEKGCIQIKTADGTTGWILEKYTTYITDEWKEYKFDSLVSIMLPKDQKFTIEEDNKFPDIFDKLKTTIERKLYNQSYYIINTHREISLQKDLEHEMKGGPSYNTKPIIKKISLNNISFYYSDNLVNRGESYGSPVYFIMFEGKNNKSYYIGIILELKTDQLEDYYLTAKKILFSVKMK